MPSRTRRLRFERLLAAGATPGGSLDERIPTRGAYADFAVRSVIVIFE